MWMWPLSSDIRPRKGINREVKIHVFWGVRELEREQNVKSHVITYVSNVKFDISRWAQREFCTCDLSRVLLTSQCCWMKFLNFGGSQFGFCSPSRLLWIQHPFFGNPVHKSDDVNLNLFCVRVTWNLTCVSRTTKIRES